MQKLGVILFLCLMLTSCNGGQQEENGAETLYAEAEKCFTEGNYNRSKILIDSIHTEFRLKVDVRKRADSLMKLIKAAEDERTKAYFDSLRPYKEAEFESLVKNFRITSDTAYHNFTKYTHKNQCAGAPRISLIAEVKDNGDLQIISVYSGRKLNHKQVKVTNKENLFVETASIDLDSPYNNRFDDYGTQWEYVTYLDYNMGDLPSFIAENADNQLKVTLIADSIETKKGKKADTYTYFLDPMDRTAVKEAVELSGVLKELSAICGSGVKGQGSSIK